MAELAQLKTVTQGEIAPTLHIGQADSPGLGTRGMQELFDAHPNLNTGAINQNAEAQNANNAAILEDLNNTKQELIEVIDAGGKTVNEHKSNFNNPHMTDKIQVGLGNVDNTSDADKPLSRAAQAAFSLKADKAYVDSGFRQMRENANAAIDAAKSAREASTQAAESAKSAGKSGETAQASAAQALESARGAAQSAGEALDAADRAAYLVTPVTGHFALSVRSDGHLIASYADGDEPPPLKIDENGDLIMTVGGVENAGT